MLLLMTKTISTIIATIYTTLCTNLIGTVQANESLKVQENKAEETITVHRSGIKNPILTQNAKAGFRPYMHPITTPSGKGTLTQYSPGHHKHQTGLYWGFTRVNGRDYFHHPGENYWRRKSLQVLEGTGKQVRWRTEYDMLDTEGSPVLTETQTWTMQIDDKDQAVLDLDWKGKARKEVTISKYNYGGLFLRMPWKKGIHARVINSAGDSNQKAEGKRSMWLDLEMQIDGLKDNGHIAIFDHPINDGFPNQWRVDGQFGIGPARSRLGDWKIEKGQTKTFLHRFTIYTGKINEKDLTEQWNAWSGQPSLISDEVKNKKEVND